MAETVLENGAPVDYLKGDFNPFMSMSHVFSGPGHRRAAMRFGDHAFDVLQKMQDEGNAAMRRDPE